MSHREDMEGSIIQVAIPAQKISIHHHLIITTKEAILGMEFPKQHQVQEVICHLITQQVQHMEAITCLEVLPSVATNGIISSMDSKT